MIALQICINDVGAHTQMIEVDETKSKNGVSNRIIKYLNLFACCCIVKQRHIERHMHKRYYKWFIMVKEEQEKKCAPSAISSFAFLLLLFVLSQNCLC